MKYFVFLLTMVLQAQDSWPVSTAAEQGVDERKFALAVDKISLTAEAHSFLVIRNGHLISEHYFNGKTKEEFHEIRSATKTIVSCLVGIAIKQGLIENIGDTVTKYLPDLAQDGQHHKLSQLKIEHLLNMTSGFEWKEHDGDLWEWQASANPIEYLLDKGFADQPGSEYSYNSATVHLLNRLIENASGMPVMDFANKYLFEPLGIAEVFWPTLADGLPNGGYGLKIRPRDLAKIGQLYLNGGVWAGNSIISNDWVTESFSGKVSLNAAIGAFREATYGNLWWNGKYNGLDIYFALGYAGQFLAVVPKLDVIVCVTQKWGLTEKSIEREDFVTELIADVVDACSG